MKCFVTGASGFVGANLVHELLARGHRVKALLRPKSDLRGLQGATFERVDGDLSDRAQLAAAIRGCEWCFHVAASYALWLPNYGPMYETNVDGTRALLHAAVEAGCDRIVYTSTVGTLRPPLPVNGVVTPNDERAYGRFIDMTNHYKRSKWHAEEIARNFALRGAPIIVVNPTAPVGPLDIKPTPTGQVIVDFLKRKMPAYLDTGLNWVHVRDVAIGHILAAEKGKPGERYILGHAEGNLTMREALNSLSEISGVPAPRVRIPHVLALGFAHLNEQVARFTRNPPKAPLAGVRMARYKMFFDPGKAIRELGIPQTPLRQALSDAVEWFRTKGYVKE